MKTREKVAELLAQGLSQNAIAATLGISKATVSYHARNLGKPRDERCNRRYDWAAIQAYYDAGRSIAQCRKRFGFSTERGTRRGCVETSCRGRSRRRSSSSSSGECDARATT